MPNRLEAPEPEAVEPTNEAETTEAPETEEKPWSLSQEEWNQYQENQKILIGATKELYDRFGNYQGPGAEPEEEFDEEDADLGTMIQRYVDGRFGEVTPILQQFQEKQGKETLAQVFDQARKDPAVGDFDDSVAERAAQSFFQNEGQGNPQAAAWAAYEGAKFAAQVRKQEREAGVKEYTDSLSKDTFSDGPAGVGGIRAPKPDESMDDVIARWSGTEEV